LSKIFARTKDALPMKAISVILFFVLFSAVNFTFAEETAARRKLQIITTLFPLYDFSKEIGKDKVDVALLLPPGIEAHAFEPKPMDIVKINNADIFIYTGRYMEPWVEDMLRGISNKRLLVVDASEGIPLMDEREEKAGHSLEEAEHNQHDHGGVDPHIWLDLGNAQIMADTIASAFVSKDRRNGAFYLDNAKEYKAKLAALDGHFKETFSRCRLKTFIYGGHFAFGYFARRYGLTYISPYRGFSPDAEPTPKSIADLINKMKKLRIKYIYYEELIDPKVARVIADETGAKLLLLNGAHNVSKKDLERGVSFTSIMEEDLNRLKLGLECQ